MVCNNLTEEEIEEKIDLIRIFVGDVPISIFYPVLTDQEYRKILFHYKCNIDRASRRAAYSVLFYLTQVSYRERAGDIEVWNNASIEYRKALNDLIGSEKGTLPDDIRPWVAGANPRDICNIQKTTVRHPLSQISPCSDWWTRVDRYDCVSDSRDQSFVVSDCGGGANGFRGKT